MRVQAFQVVHRGSGNYGFIFEQKSHRPFQNAQAEALGVPAGPERAQLVQGNPVTLDDGRVIEPDDVLGKAIPGAKLVHVGDVARLDEVTEPARNADCLVIESTYLDEETDIARSVGHITAGEAARLATEIGVKTLILTHISRRNSERQVRDEAQRYHNHVFVARDFDHFQIVRGSQARKLDLTGE